LEIGLKNRAQSHDKADAPPHYLLGYQFTLSNHPGDGDEAVDIL